MTENAYNTAMLRIAVISLLVANLLLLGFRGSKPVAEPETAAKQTVVEDSSVPTIHLFSEMMSDQDLMSGSRRCFSLGPFHSVEDKNETRALLEDVLANVSERETQALVEKGYWVFMPPYESLLVANQALLSLQALGLKDIAVIYNGDWENAVSLGYFLRQENALRRKKDLEDRGFAPKIRVQRQSESRYWLDYEQNPGSGLIAMDMQNRPNDFMQRALPCPDQNPFESTAGVAGVSENPDVETEQPQTQLPEEQAQPAVEENIDTASVDNAEVAEPEPAIETESENGLGVEPQNGDEAVTDQVILAEPENEPGAELQNSNELEPEALENLVDDSSRRQVETPEEGVPEEDDGLQAIEDDAINAAEITDSTPIDGEKAVPGPVIETGPAIETELENSVGAESVIETKPENSVGTGPVIGFGTESEDSDENEAENSDEAGVEDSFGTELEDSDGTETDGG